MRAILLYLIVGLLSSAFLLALFNQRLFSASATNLVEQWSEVGLKAELLDPYMGPECYQSENSFIACHLAFDRMRFLLHPRLASKEGSLREQFSKYAKIFRAVDAKKLKPIDFAKGWQQLKEELEGRRESSLVVATGINSLLHLHRDPHTLLVPRERYNEMVHKTGRDFFGIGISVSQAGDLFRVSRVVPKSPAAKAGLVVGDTLISIEGLSVKGQNLLEVRRQLGTEEALTVELGYRKVDGSDHQVELKKAPLRFNNVEAKIVSTPAGVPSLFLTIARFSKGVCEEVKSQVVEALEANVVELILDLRGNPGGPLTEAACVADLFLPKNLKVFEVRYFDETKPREIYKSHTTALFTYPVITIVDAQTASAAELLAGALRDHDRSFLIGERTYGKGSFQRGRVWVPYENAILLETQGLYYLPSGLSPQLIGLTPDLKFDLGTTVSEREEGLFLNARPAQPATQVSNIGLMAEMTRGCFGLNPSPGASEAIGAAKLSNDAVVSLAGRLSDCLRSDGAFAALPSKKGL